MTFELVDPLHLEEIYRYFVQCPAIFIEMNENIWYHIFMI